MTGREQTQPSPDRARPTTADDVRRTFIEFFASRGHRFVASSPVVPVADPTLLFTNAGMNQFKPAFLGQVEPGSHLEGLARAVNSQKCIRAGGKHNDLDDVGKDTFHHTFFEMLGNWSFGDYFKADAIAWAWELLTEVFALAPDRIYATYFGGDETSGLEPDDEARDLWLRHLPPERVLPFGLKDNFWEMGETGPCGPCSEIHYDRVGDRDAGGLVNADDPDVIELWNLVFIQFDRQPAGGAGPTPDAQTDPDASPASTILTPLPARHVDTGMGLERLVSILQGKSSNYDTDLFGRIFAGIEATTGARAYTGRVGAADLGNIDTAYRVIADHIRCLTFAITDGAVPGNEGRGYVLRRIIRRAVRYGRQMLGARTGFFSGLVPIVVETMGEAFPELHRNPQRVQEILLEEEESFGRTLDRGLVINDEFQAKAIQRAEVNLESDAAREVGAVSAEVKVRQMVDHVTPRRAGYQSPEDRKAGMDRFIEQIQRPRWGVGIVYRNSDGNELGRAGSTLDGPHIRSFVERELRRAPEIAGEDAFRLYDTYGFPLDLTQLMAEERGLTVDVEGYERCMAEQRERSRAAIKSGPGDRIELTTASIEQLKRLNVPATEDSDKFHSRPIRATVRAIWNGRSFDDRARDGSSLQRIGIVLDKTNFYAEAGGQVADTGRMLVTREARSGASDAHEGGQFKVQDVRSTGGYVLHVGHVTRGEVRVGDDVELRVDKARRQPIQANHTATHLLNFALRDVLGDGVDQKGSLVAPDRLRFDFSNLGPVEPEKIARVEQIVRERIDRDLTVYAEAAPLYVATSINGVRAVFGERYPDPVRVVSIGQPVSDLLDSPDNVAWREVSVEFCGGTHVESTGQIGPFAVVSETGIAKGIRRVEALTGVPATAAIRAADRLRERIDRLGRQAESGEARRLDDRAPGIGELAGEIDQMTMPLASKHELRSALGRVQDVVKRAKKAAGATAAKEATSVARRIAESAQAALDDIIVASIEVGSDRGALNAALETIRQTCPKSAVMLLSPDAKAGRVSITAAVPDAMVTRGLNAGDWLREAAQACGGKGGGRATTAQGGGSEPGKIKQAIAAARAAAHRALR